MIYEWPVVEKLIRNVIHDFVVCFGKATQTRTRTLLKWEKKAFATGRIQMQRCDLEDHPQSMKRAICQLPIISICKCVADMETLDSTMQKQQTGLEILALITS